MLTHDGIWAAIDALAAHNEMSASGLAKAAGLDPTTFNKSKRISREGKSRWPSTESIAKILAATNSNLSDLLALLEHDEVVSTNQRLPMLSFNTAVKDGHFNELGSPVGADWDEVMFPDLRDPTAFALEIKGEDYAPIFSDGTILIMSPQSEVRRGDRVVARTTDNRVIVRSLLRKTALRLELQSILHDGKTELIHITDLVWMARIMWVSH